MSQVDRRLTRHAWYENVFERFPFTLFSGVQSFILYQNFTDFVGGVVEYPIALVQYPYYFLTGRAQTFPSNQSEIQALINSGRFRSFYADVI